MGGGTIAAVAHLDGPAGCEDVSMRVRFPPSPTGALHIGNARTALYNWLLARGQGGELVLRIEDTDRERSTPENVEYIFDALRWLGIDWDEGPIYQSANAPRHAAVVEQLLADGHAYRTTAGPEAVRAYKEAHDGRGFRGTDEGEGAVRLRVPDEGTTLVRDVIRGETAFENALLDDLVIARADGSPVYHLAVVVDDADAGITHVVRGADHYSNTPKQLLIQQAMGAPTPVYAHLPLLNGPDGKKLSKRHGATSVQELRESGYLPEAVINYLALLGWGYDEATTFFTIEELQERFTLERVSKAPAAFDEQKLRWMNGRYLRDLSVEDLTRRLEAYLGRPVPPGLVAITQDKISTLEEFWPLAQSFLEGPINDPAAREKWLGPDARAGLAQAREALAELPEPWQVEGVEGVLRGVSEQLGVKPKQLFQPLRVALTGTTVSPGIFETVALLGRDETLARLDDADHRRNAA
jgi:glutamyl-tRNA synthetase